MNLNENETKILLGLRAAVAERGEDWVYPVFDGTNGEWFSSYPGKGERGTCINKLPDGSPACIFGFAAIHAGLRVGSYGAVSAYWEGWGITFAVLTVLIDAQTKQDAGARWGFVLQQVEKTLIDKGYILPE